MGGHSFPSAGGIPAIVGIENAAHLASQAPELIRLPMLFEGLRELALCACVDLPPAKQIAKTIKIAREPVLAADIASSPAPTARPPQPACRGASSDGHQPDEAAQTVQSATGANRETKTYVQGHLKYFWSSHKLEIRGVAACYI